MSGTCNRFRILGLKILVYVASYPHALLIEFSGAEGVAGSRMAGTIVLTGRQKDTIVLSNGENIEPQPIEDACCASNYISHMIVVGNDRRRLGALVAPAVEAFEELEGVKGESSACH